MAIIDIIVPIYNTEPYLKRCIDSVLNQTFQDFRLLLVDDGSTDASSAICDEYAEKEQKIQVIHKENGGVSDAKNRGLEEIQSEYLTFVDSDDYLDSRYLESLYQALEEHSADLVLSCHINTVEKDFIRLREKTYKEKTATSKVISKADAYRYMLDKSPMLTTSWGKLYHQSLFRTIRFPVGEIYEDMKVTKQLVENSTVIAYTDYRGYYYVHRQGSYTQGTFTSSHKVLLKNAQYLRTWIHANYPDVSEIADRNYFWNCLALLNGLGSDPVHKQYCKGLRKKVLKDWRNSIFGREIPIMQRLGTICLIPGISFYRSVYRIMEGPINRTKRKI